MNLTQVISKALEGSQRPQDPTLSTAHLEISWSMKCSSWEILKGYSPIWRQGWKEQQSVLSWSQALNLGLASARVSVSALAASSSDCRDFDHFLLQLVPSRFRAPRVAPSLCPSPCPSYSRHARSLCLFPYLGEHNGFGEFQANVTGNSVGAQAQEHHQRLSGTCREDGEPWRCSLRWHPAFWGPVSVMHA